MRFGDSDPAAGQEGEEGKDDPFAEFPAEPNRGADVPKDHDWLSEFADEKPAPKVVRSRTWRQLTENLKDDGS